MNALVELLADCKEHGIQLNLAGDENLTIDAPAGVLTADLVDRFKLHKVGLLAALRTEADSTTPAANASVGDGGQELDQVDEEQTDDEPVETPQATCRCHKEQRWWRSTYGDHLICGVCHPPVSPNVLSEWVSDSPTNPE